VYNFAAGPISCGNDNLNEDFQMANSWAPPLRQKRLAPFLLLALGILLVAYVQYAIITPMNNLFAPDLAVNYSAATLLREGRFIYDSAALQEAHKQKIGASPEYAALYQGLYLTYNNLPSTALLIWPFGLLQFSTARVAYLFVCNVLYLGSVWLLLRSTKTRILSLPGFVVCLFALASYTLLVSFALGQVDALIIATLTLALLCTFERHDAWAGALIVLAAVLKISPILVLAFFVAQKRWRALLGAAVAGVCLFGMMVVASGLNTLEYFAATVLPAIGRGSAYYQNQSLLGAIYRFNVPATTVTSLDALGDYPLDRIVWLGLSGLLFSVTFCLVKRAKLSHRPTLALAFSVFILLGPLIGAIAWDHYLTWLIIPITALIVDWFQTRWMNAKIFWLTLSIIMIGLNFPAPLQLTLYQTTGPMASSFGTCTMLLMLAVIWCRLWTAGNTRVEASQQPAAAR
jgi:alpha-1,2-mannosyltransferase